MAKSKPPAFTVSVVQASKHKWKLEADSCGTLMRSEESFGSEEAAEEAAKEVRRGDRDMFWIVRK